MAARETEALVAALEACAATLEHKAGASAAFGQGSLPRLRPPSLGVGLARMAPAAPWLEAPPAEPGLGEDALELAAEFRDVAQAVENGQAGRGWLNSLLGRASRHLDVEALAQVRAAALGVL